MHIQIVTFRLKGTSAQDYAAGCDEVAPTFAAIPGLISKVWLADERSNTYGGVYSWRDRAAMEAYLKTDLFRAIVSDPTLEDVTSRDFPILEGPTAVTTIPRSAVA